MVTETYKYFKPDTILRPSYGGNTIINGGDSAEINSATLTIRHIFKNIDFQKYGTRYLCIQGLASGLNWFKISDNLYPAITPFLSSAELTTVQSTAPSGFSVVSQKAQLQPHSERINLIWRGDSIPDGTSVTNGKRDVYASLAIQSLENNLGTFSETDRILLGKKYCLINLSLGGSSWADTGSIYPQREDLAYNQRTKTLPLNHLNKCIFVYNFTNDLPYDLTLTPAQNFTRAQNRIQTLKTDFPTIKVVVCTNIKRTENTTLNSRIHDYNNLLRSGYLSIGADAICDFAAIPSFHPLTGDTTNTSYYSSDGIHLVEGGHTLMMPTAKAMIATVENLS